MNSHRRHVRMFLQFHRYVSGGCLAFWSIKMPYRLISRFIFLYLCAVPATFAQHPPTSSCSFRHRHTWPIVFAPPEKTNSVLAITYTLVDCD